MAASSTASRPDGAVCDGDKYFWVQAESFAAAALLAVRTGDAAYWDWYDRIWAYAWQHFVDHEHGAWYRILTPDNRKLDRREEPRRQDRLPHHGRLLRRAACPGRLNCQSKYSNADVSRGSLIVPGLTPKVRSVHRSRVERGLANSLTEH